ncbi:hypothetical protein [Elizabethkingia sp. JS20170427COW]|nr:hypothetical protein [Elizabethkingia sp. JS20170427COW]
MRFANQVFALCCILLHGIFQAQDNTRIVISTQKTALVYGITAKKN